MLDYIRLPSKVLIALIKDKPKHYCMLSLMVAQRNVSTGMSHFLNIKSLSEQAGISREHGWKIIKYLEDEGYIKREDKRYFDYRWTFPCLGEQRVRITEKSTKEELEKALKEFNEV